MAMDIDLEGIIGLGIGGVVASKALDMMGGTVPKKKRKRRNRAMPEQARRPRKPTYADWENVPVYGGPVPFVRTGSNKRRF